MAAHARCPTLMRSILRNKVLQTKEIHTTVPVTAGQSRRLKLGEAGNKTSYGFLTDLPDFSYLDGRPTPLSVGQRRRKEARINTAKRIVELVKEMEDAKVIYQNKIAKQQEEMETRQKQTLRAKVK